MSITVNDLRTRVAATIAGLHAIEEFRVEQRPVSGIPSVGIYCRCGRAFDGLTDHAEHVASEAIVRYGSADAAMPS